MKKSTIFLILAIISIIVLIVASYYDAYCSCDASKRSLYLFVQSTGKIWLTLLSTIFLSLFILKTISRKVIKIISLTILWFLVLGFLYISWGTYASRSCPDAKRVSAVQSVRIALAIYKNDHGIYPKSLDELVDQYLPIVPSYIEYYKLKEDSYRIGATLECQTSYQDDLRPNDPVFEVGP